MKRVTKRAFHVKPKGIEPYKFDIECSMYCDDCTIGSAKCDNAKSYVERLAAIEDILGDDYDLDRLRDLVEADKDGQCIVLDQDTVLSMLAGASAIRQNNRLCLSTYLFDMKKKYGGPFQIDYIVAEENLRKIGYAALKGENHG